MKKTIHFLLFLVCVGIIACKQQSNDILPEQEDVEVEVNQSYLMIFNASSEIGGIDFAINGRDLKSSIQLADNSPYYDLNTTKFDVTISKSQNGEVLLTREVSLEGGYLYSSYFYITKDGKPELLLVKGLKESERRERQDAITANFTAVNLAKHTPSEGLSVHNVAFSRVTRSSINQTYEYGGPYVYTWTDKVDYGKSSSNQNSYFKTFTNALVFSSSKADPDSFENPYRINFPSIEYDQSEEWVNHGGCQGYWDLQGFPYNASVEFKGNGNLAFIAFDDDSKSANLDGRIIDLNAIKMIEVDLSN